MVVLPFLPDLVREKDSIGDNVPIDEFNEHHLHCELSWVLQNNHNLPEKSGITDHTHSLIHRFDAMHNA